MVNCLVVIESVQIHSQGGSLPFTGTLCCYLPLTASVNEAGRAYVKRHCFYKLCMFHYPTNRHLCPDRQFYPIQVITLWMASVCGGKWPVPWFSLSCGYCSRCFTVFSVCVPIMLWELSGWLSSNFTLLHSFSLVHVFMDLRPMVDEAVVYWHGKGPHRRWQSTTDVFPLKTQCEKKF